MVYTFNATAFADYIWIKNGDEFSNVTLIEIEMVNAGSFRLEVVKDGQVISIGPRGNEHGGWSTFSFSGGMEPAVFAGQSPYKLKLVNTSAGTRQLKLGNVHYNP